MYNKKKKKFRPIPAISFNTHSVASEVKPKVHTIRFMQLCVTCDSCIICGWQVTPNEIFSTGFLF